jgi:hypothetical protein
VLALSCGHKAILRTAAVAHAEHLAVATLRRQRLPLGLTKGLLLGAVKQLNQSGFIQIAQPVLRRHIVIAAIEIAIFLQHWHAAEGLSEDAQGMVKPKGCT